MNINLDALLVVLGVVPLVVLVWLLVEALKVYGVVKEDSWLTAPRAGITAGILLGVLALVPEFLPAYAEAVNLVVHRVAAGVFAGLFYELFGDPILTFAKSLVQRVFNPSGPASE